MQEYLVAMYCTLNKETRKKKKDKSIFTTLVVTYTFTTLKFYGTLLRKSGCTQWHRKNYLL